MSSTALGAGTEKTQEIIFINEAHEKFYYEKYNQSLLPAGGTVRYVWRWMA